MNGCKKTDGTRYIIRRSKLGKYNIGEVWWTRFPFQDSDEEKHRPAVVIDEKKIAVLAMMVTSKNKDNPYYIEIEDWKCWLFPYLPYENSNKEHVFCKR